MRLGYKAHESLQCPGWDRDRMAGRFLGFKVWDRRGIIVTRDDTRL